jgi:hypothetical protein
MITIMKVFGTAHLHENSRQGAEIEAKEGMRLEVPPKCYIVETGRQSRVELASDKSVDGKRIVVEADSVIYLSMPANASFRLLSPPTKLWIGKLWAEIETRLKGKNYNEEDVKQVFNAVAGVRG